MKDQIKELIDLNKVNRIELIKNAKRHFVTWEAKEVKISLQDNNRTLKIFFKE